MADQKNSPAGPQLTELEALEIEERKLRLEVMREQVAQMHAQKDQAARNRQRQAETEEHNRIQTRLQQSACAHKKAGTGVKGIFTGSAAEYSIIKHTEPWGETYVMCQRCGLEWRDPFFMLRRTDPKRVSAAKKADPRGYEKKMREYKWAMDLPTDNSPSGGTVFSIQRDVDFESSSV